MAANVFNGCADSRTLALINLVVEYAHLRVFFSQCFSYFVAAIGTLDNPRVVVAATPFSEIGTDDAAEAPPVVEAMGGGEDMDMASEDMDSDEDMASDDDMMGGETIADIAMANEDFSTLVDVVVAADGVESKVGQWSGINTRLDPKDLETCCQYTLTNIECKDAYCDFYLGSRLLLVVMFGFFQKEKMLLM